MLLCANRPWKQYKPGDLFDMPDQQAVEIVRREIARPVKTDAPTISDNPTMDVWIISYERYELLRLCLWSVCLAARTRPWMRVHVVDDASTDQRVIRLLRTCQQTGTIELVRHQQNRGLGASFATSIEGFLAGDGDLYVRLDGDMVVDGETFDDLRADALSLWTGEVRENCIVSGFVAHRKPDTEPFPRRELTWVEASAGGEGLLMFARQWWLENRALPTQIAELRSMEMAPVRDRMTYTRTREISRYTPHYRIQHIGAGWRVLNGEIQSPPLDVDGYLKAPDTGAEIDLDVMPMKEFKNLRGAGLWNDHYRRLCERHAYTLPEGGASPFRKRRILLYFYQHLLEPFQQALTAGGYTAEAADRNDLAKSLNTPDAIHLIWGYPHPLVSAEDHLWERLRDRNDVWFMEQGWLPQAGHFYIDHLGANGLSSIRGAALGVTLTEADRAVLQQRLRVYHGPTESGDDGYVFCPLQVETDANVEQWSNIPASVGHRMCWFARQVAEAFVGTPVVFRPHPKGDRETDRFVERLCKEMTHCRLETGGTSMQWAAKARAVVAINSTCVTEAVSYYKPTLAIGDGIFSENGVVLEAKGQAGRLRDVLTYQPDREAIDRYLHLLYQRQIPIAVQPDEFSRYPKLAEFLAMIAKPAAPAEPASIPPVWAFVEYVDLRNPRVPTALLECTKQPGVAGILLNDSNLREFHMDIVRAVAPLPVIPMYTDPFILVHPEWAHLGRIDYAKTFSGKIALGQSPTQEWSGTAKDAMGYIRFGKANGFEWACTLTHYSLLQDLANGGTLRDVLARHNVTTFCLCGNVLLGYLFNEPNMPGLNDTTLTGHNLHREFGLTVERLAEYCRPLNIYSGAGGQPGLMLGSRRYAQQCGFKGNICFAPFDLSGTLDVETKPIPARYPAVVRGNDVGIGRT